MNVQQGTGKPTKRFGQEWIGVPLTGSMVIKKEKIEVRFLQLYDPRTKQLQHSIDLSDEIYAAWAKS